MTPEERIEELGFTLPTPPKPVGSYVTAVRTGNLLFVSGMLPLVDGALPRTGAVGLEVTEEQATEDARQAALNLLAVVREAAGGLGKVTRVVKLTGFVASHPSFTGQPTVINGASDLMTAVFGDAGRHARAAVGVPVLPLGATVELESVFELGG
jgi:enamine deaminase RidA (YjgF/YER057c/UK114 family)